MRESFNLVSTVILGVSLLSGAAQAQIFNVPARGEQKIDRHGACRIVSNTSSTAIMVPTNTSQEWSTGTSSFLQNISNMPGVSARSCEGPWTAQHNICGDGKSSCVIMDWWVPMYAVIVDGELDRACLISPKKAANLPYAGVNATWEAKDAGEWAAWTRTNDNGAGGYRIWSQHLINTGFVDAIAAKANGICHIKPGYDRWYNWQSAGTTSNAADLKSIFNDPSYAQEIELVPRVGWAYSSPPWHQLNDNREIYIWNLK